MVELSQLGMSNGDTYYVHTDPISTQDQQIGSEVGPSYLQNCWKEKKNILSKINENLQLIKFFRHTDKKKQWFWFYVAYEFIIMVNVVLSFV